MISSINTQAVCIFWQIPLGETSQSTSMAGIPTSRATQHTATQDKLKISLKVSLLVDLEGGKMRLRNLKE